jgi:mannose-6-phosphate isomerase-like protein (cupin superfamily)
MQGFVGNIEKKTLENGNFRAVLYTAAHCQLVVMSIPPGGEIGEEVHVDNDQFLRVEQGEGAMVLDGVEHAIADGSAVIVPAGTRHNLINTGPTDLRLYTLYSPPHHRDGIVHETKAAADADGEEFDGKTTE